MEKIIIVLIVVIVLIVGMNNFQTNQSNGVIMQQNGALITMGNTMQNFDRSQQQTNETLGSAVDMLKSLRGDVTTLQDTQQKQSVQIDSNFKTLNTRIDGVTSRLDRLEGRVDQGMTITTIGQPAPAPPAVTNVTSGGNTNGLCWVDDNGTQVLTPCAPLPAP